MLRVLCVLGTLTGTAFFLARGTADLLRMRFTAAMDPAGRPKREFFQRESATASDRVDAIADPHAILARNVFDPTTGPLWPPEVSEPPPPPSLPPEPQEVGLRRCDSEVRISAAAYHSRHPERSWVILRSPQDPSGRIYRQGMPLGERTLVEILPRAIRLQSGDSSCLIGMFTEGSREKIAREQAVLAPPKGKRARSKKAARNRERRGSGAPVLSAEELATGILKIDDERYRIDRKLVDKAFERAARIAGTTRLTPVQRRGRVIGLRLVRMRRDGLLSRIGLQRGDILRNVNGYDVGNTEALLGAYARLADAERLTLAVKRGSRFFSFEYSIQ